jgi:DNA-binding Xre family transcriptional regulator
MPMRWKLDAFLKAHNITVYALAKKTEGKLTRTTLYNLTNKPQKRIELETLNVLIPTLSKMLGKQVKLDDLLDYADDAGQDA